MREGDFGGGEEADDGVHGALYQPLLQAVHEGRVGQEGQEVLQ